MLGMKAQRIRSAKFICVRAPRISAPMIPLRINRCIARAERRVKNHMIISKLKPRWNRDRFLGFIRLISASSQRSADDDDDSSAVEGQEDGPFHPNGFTLVLDQSRPQVENG